MDAVQWPRSGAYPIHHVAAQLQAGGHACSLSGSSDWFGAAAADERTDRDGHVSMGSHSMTRTRFDREAISPKPVGLGIDAER